MSATTRIEQALLRLDGAAYQKLCDAYLRREGYKNLESFGSRPGSNKTRRGTPDSYAILPDGRLVFVEYTTQQDDTFEKLAGDLTKCLDAETTGVPLSQLAEVFLFYTGRLAPHERAALIDRASAAEVLLRPVSLEQLAHELNERHRQLAYEALGVELDTRQLLSVDDFVVAAGASRFATSLAVPFRFREAEVSSAVAALADGVVVLLSGHPGVGKTRLALEVCRSYAAAHPEALVRCLFNRGLDLFHELQQLLATPGQILLFVDDANRFGGLDALVQLVEEDRLRDSSRSRSVAKEGLAGSNAAETDSDGFEPSTVDAAAGVLPQGPGPRVSLLLTVRDYARDQVSQTLAQRGGFRGRVTAQGIGRLTDAQIAELLEDSFGIRNGYFVERIQKVACGNPRLAMMAGRVAVDEQTLASINDVTALYDQYFESIRRDLGDLANRRPLLVGACIAFFRAVDGENAVQMAAVEKVFGIPAEEFWREAKQLHELELVDIHADTAVKMSDQILGTYLLHLAVFRQRVLPVAALLEGTFASFGTRLRDALGGILNAFDADSVIDAIRPAVDRMWLDARSQQDSGALDAIIRAFWFVRPDGTIAEISRWVHEQPHGETTGSRVDGPVRADDRANLPFRLEILPVFRTYSEDLTRIAAAVACDYLAKRPEEAGGVLHLLAHGFGFRHDSALYGFVAERAVLDEVLGRGASGDPLFTRATIGLAAVFLQLEFQTSSSSEESVLFRRFAFEAKHGGAEIRVRLWEELARLRADARYAVDVRAVLANYAKGLGVHTLSGDEPKAVVASDAPHVHGLLRTLDPDDLADCFLARDVLFAMAGWGVRSPAALTRRFRHVDILLAERLYDRWQPHRKGGWRAIEAASRRKLRALAGDLPTLAYGDFFERVARIHTVAAAHGQDRNDWFLQSRLTTLLRDLAERRPADYPSVLKAYIDAGDPAALPTAPLLDALIRGSSADDAYSFTMQIPESRRARWEAGYFTALPERETTRERADRVIALFEAGPIEGLPAQWDVVARLRPTEPAVVRRVVAALARRSANEPAAGRVLVWLLMGADRADQAIREDFAGDPALLFRAYVVADAAGDHFDYDGAIFEAATDLDPQFPVKFVDHAYADESRRFRFDDHRDYSRLWKRADAHALVTRIALRVMELERERFGMDTWLSQLLVQREGDNASVKATQDAWLAAMIVEHAGDREMIELLFRSTTKLAEQRRLAMFEVFLKHNASLEAFKALPLEHWMQMATGSWVPVEERRREFLESLVSLCNRPALLSHREHLLERVVERRRRITDEKRRDFLK